MQNTGKGAALKIGLAYIDYRFPKDAVVVTVDADGQHKPNDAPAIAAVAVEALTNNNHGNFFLQYFPNMCKSGSPPGEPLLFYMM